ncbi:MAG: TetR/AcrR family transcriptional regulator [Enterocloster asparagiformis]|nr:TetR/AcrR family transcriptional regulator [Enterocloster asparagiformis]
MRTCGRETRTPKQARSRQTAQRILDTARLLFCEKGYYNTTTNEIARTAGISIGSLYSYFSDKETILALLLEQHNQQFDAVFADLETELNRRACREDLHERLSCLVARLAQQRQSDAPFDRLLKQLCYARPEVAAVVHRQAARVQNMVESLLLQNEESVKAETLRPGIAVIVDFINVLADRIAFGESGGLEEGVLTVGVDMLCAACGRLEADGPEN